MDSAAAATQIRIFGALPFFLILLLVMRRQRNFIRAFGDLKSMGIISLGSVAGPTLGVALLMYALKTIPAGIAMTLVSLMPVIIIPFTIVIYKDRVSLRAVFGAIIAVIGSALLSL